MTRTALSLLDTGRNDAYQACLAALRLDTREWWTDDLARNSGDLDQGEEPWTPDPDSLRAFLTDKVLPWFEDRAKEIAHRPLIRAQAYGEALDPGKLERLGRYEVHLDRKFERTLSMLLKLKELRRADRGGIICLAKTSGPPPVSDPGRKSGRNHPSSGTFRNIFSVFNPYGSQNNGPKLS